MVPISALLTAASLSSDETETLFIVLALVFLCGAGYLAWVRNFAGAAVLAVLAVVAAFLAT